MQSSEYKTQAYINEGLNQQHGLDSPEGSAALIQSNKPEVDATDIQKEQILAKANDHQASIQILTPVNQKKIASDTINSIQSMKSPHYKKN